MAKLSKTKDSIEVRPSTLKGIGKTFEKDLKRIGIEFVSQLKGKDPEKLFEKLVKANEKENHKTSRNYLYVMRLAVYQANGGNDHSLLFWSKWKEIT
jgi:Pathogenicity locus